MLVQNESGVYKEGMMMGWAAREAYEKTGDSTFTSQLFDGYIRKFFKEKGKTLAFQNMIDDIHKYHYDLCCKRIRVIVCKLW